MADPVSVAGSVAGLISLGIQVTQSLVDFYNSYKALDSDLFGMTQKMECLLEIFCSLEKAISDRNFQEDERELIKSIETSIKACDELVQELQDECQKFNKTSSNGFEAAVRIAGRRATYPFRKSTLQKLDENIDEIRTNLSFALGALQLRDNRRIKDDITEIKTLLDLVKTNQISSNLRDWLKAPDATIDHNRACLKKFTGTGLWLVRDPRFTTWLTEGNSILWLNGFAGSGKSVLCSTAIQFVLRHRRSDPRIGIAFFYFTFHDESKRDESAMLRALLLQLSTQLQDGHADLVKLYNSYERGTVPSQVLIIYLRRLIERFRDVFIILDALDESPRDGARGHVLDTLETMRKWGLQGLHLFFTSRNERDINESFNLSTDQQVAMQNLGIDRDIADFILGRLDASRSLQKWRKYRDKIQESLASRAKGVFRWVECQLKALQSCPCSQSHLDRLLNSLPQSLDETYERMLCNIDQDLVKDARRILVLLCFASRPLTLRELIDGIAVEINEPLGLDKDCRLEDYNDIHDICPGFIDINLAADQTSETYNERNLLQTVQIAHFSVQEYLESNRIRHQKAAIFGLASATAHAEIAQICLVYLLEHDFARTELDQSILEEYPLAPFAAMYWYHHYERTTEFASGLDHLVSRLFQQKGAFMAWVKLCDIDQNGDKSVDLDRTSDDIAGPVYYTSLLGLYKVVYDLTSIQQLESREIPAESSTSTSEASKLINAQGGYFGNALRAASDRGHEKVVQLLLDRGADVNAITTRQYGSALYFASYQGHEKVIQLLLDRGADIHAQVGYYGNALQTAILAGHETIVQLLLDRGADVNAQGGRFGNALQTASITNTHHEIMVQLLLDRGAKVNAQGGYFGHVLQAASYLGHEQVVRLLLYKGANVNAQNGRYGNALYAASFEGHRTIVQLLLARGADVNAQGGYYGEALYAASYLGHEQVVRLLLCWGADVHAQGGGFGNALYAASLEGHKTIVQLLLDRGADVNAQCGYYGDALQAASTRGYWEVVQILQNNRAALPEAGDSNGGFTTLDRRRSI